MARKSNTRAAQGAGSIRQRPDGRWEGRFTYLDELGQTKRGSVYAATQKQCRQKLTAAVKSVDEGGYKKTQRYTVAEWMETWITTYCRDLKPSTQDGYRSKMNTWINPALGKVQLSALTNTTIQRFYNQLADGAKGRNPLSPKSLKNIHGIFHRALKQAVIAGLIPSNPADFVKLSKVKKAELYPLMDDDVSKFLAAIKGDRFERLFILALFSGMRQSELIGLRWEDVDMEIGTILVCRQIQKSRTSGEYIHIDETKNGKQRIAAIAPSVVKVLKEQKRQQMEWRLAAGELWENTENLVFTDELGRHIRHNTMLCHFKEIVTSIGRPNVRFHDLRHSYAISALQAGDSIKNVQEQLGHYSSAFTMDVYAAVSDTMRKDSQARMEAVFKAALGG